MKTAYIFLFVIGVAVQVIAQSSCPGCTISLPDSLAVDTIYLGSTPSATVFQPYEADLSFRMPMTTTAVANAGVNVPSGLNITQIEILQVNNLPPGLSWEASQTIFAVQEETDGCVRFCGTPLLVDSFRVEVVVRASLGVLFSQETSFFVPLVVEAASSSNNGFTLLNNEGCGSVEVSFINEVASNGLVGFSYFWDFGNGLTSSLENPPSQIYNSPGIYPITYEATIDTMGYFLSEIKVLATDCTDAFGGRPDLKLDIHDPNGNLILVTNTLENTNLPAVFPLFLEMSTGEYSVTVIDVDAFPSGPDDICGTIAFNRENPGVFTAGPLTIEISVFHPTETVLARDTVMVYEQPSPPLFAAIDNPLICPTDSVRLSITNFADLGEAGYLTWFQDSTDLFLLPDQTTYYTASPALYQVRYTSPDGCLSTSTAPAFDLLPEPDTVLLENFGNLVQVFGVAIPEGLLPRWYLDGALTDESQLRFCATASGLYTLELIDPQTGCSSQSSIFVVVDPSLNCDVVNTAQLPQERNNWQLFPNPSQGPVSLRGYLSEPAQLDIQLLDATGRLLQRSNYRANAGEWQQTLALPTLAAGVYYLQVRTDRGLTVLKLLR